MNKSVSKFSDYKKTLSVNLQFVQTVVLKFHLKCIGLICNLNWMLNIGELC